MSGPDGFWEVRLAICAIGSLAVDLRLEQNLLGGIVGLDP